MEAVSIRELKQQAGPVPAILRFHAQLEKALERTTKTGNPFYELKFADAEETLVLRVWNNTPMFAACSELRDRQFFEISGEFGLGNDGRSVDGKNWTARALNDEETGRLLSGSAELRRKQDADYAFIEDTVGQIADPRLRRLSLAFLEQYGERFKRTGAARGYHHARRGGLVEHVAQMMRAAVQICEAYSLLNRDLLVTGVLFHDVGKLWENVYADKGFSMPVTEISELVGHIPLGMEIVNKLWRGLADDEALATEWRGLEPGSDRVRLHLLHLVAAHHGEMEFGSPVVPKTPEAQALHYIDNLDAKMEMFERGYQIAGEVGKNIYERVRPLPGRLVAPLPEFEGAGDQNQPVEPETPASGPEPEPAVSDDIPSDVPSAGGGHEGPEPF
ncbi:MAG: HD domain-containing protein [Verrucomicrobiales bacterium]